MDTHSLTPSAQHRVSDLASGAHGSVALVLQTLETTLGNINSLGPAGALWDAYVPWRDEVAKAIDAARAMNRALELCYGLLHDAAIFLPADQVAEAISVADAVLSPNAAISHAGEDSRSQD